MTFGFARKFISRLESFLPIDPVVGLLTNNKLLRAAVHRAGPHSASKAEGLPVPLSGLVKGLPIPLSVSHRLST